MGLFSIFYTSLRALNAYSGALSVVANNIANSSNENYSRQRIEFTTPSPESAGGLEIGRGVVIGSIEQFVDAFTEKRLTNAVQDQQRYEARSQALRNTEAIFNELDGDGLQDATAAFFDAFSALSSEPDSTSLRNNVLAAGQNVSNLFNQYGLALEDQRTTIDLQIKNIVPFLNDRLEQLSDLNQEIRDSTTNTLAYKDERRKVINDIAQYIDVSAVETNDEIQLYTKSGNPLVNGSSLAVFSVATNVANSNLYDVNMTIGDTTATITSTIQSGQLKGLIEARDTYVGSYQTKLNDMAYQLATQVNTQHRAGFDLSGTNNRYFFTNFASATNAAKTLDLHADVDGLPNRVAASSLAASVPGGNDNALLLAAMGDSTTIPFSSGNNSFTAYYGDLLGTVGSDSNITQSGEAFQTSILNQTKLQRTEIGGVNVDEEEANLIKYQSAYQASGRLVKVADSILETLINALL